VQRPAWAPPEAGVDRPSPSRIYDYLLGGCHNFAADREVARALLELEPSTALVAKANRAFLHRAVRELVGLGVDQFLDIGSGIPTVGNVHEIAQSLRPGTRVVYVDLDPVAVAHSQLILGDHPDAGVIQADLRDTAAILDHPVTTRLLDFTRPVAVLLMSMLHFLPDDDEVAGCLRRLRERLAPDSYLAISHLLKVLPPAQRSEAHERYNRTVTAITLRSRERIAAFFAGFELIEPGLVTATRWRPEGEAAVAGEVAIVAGVGVLGARCGTGAPG
jgi:SAM-dependent methyltransferase